MGRKPKLNVRRFQIKFSGEMYKALAAFAESQRVPITTVIEAGVTAILKHGKLPIKRTKKTKKADPPSKPPL